MPEPGEMGAAPKTAKNGVTGACNCDSKCGRKVCPCFDAGQECRPHSEDAPGYVYHAPKPDAKKAGGVQVLQHRRRPGCQGRAQEVEAGQC